MGATLPTLTRFLTQDGSLSRAFGRLYAANTIGAIVGTLVAGLVLIELLGLSGALAVGAACSAVAGLAALWLARGVPVRRSRRNLGAEVEELVEAQERAGAQQVAVLAAPTPARAAAALGARPANRTRLALTVAFVSGLTSLGYQVLWTRMLASGTGNTTYVFTVILAMFLIGLAIGALLFNLIRSRITSPARLLAVTQVLAGALVLYGLVGVIARPARRSIPASRSRRRRS